MMGDAAGAEDLLVLGVEGRVGDEVVEDTGTGMELEDLGVCEKIIA